MLPWGPHTLCRLAVTLQLLQKAGLGGALAAALAQAGCAHCSGEAGDPQSQIVSG